MRNNIVRYRNKVTKVISKWYREFIKSEEFAELSSEEKMLSQDVITTFAETVYMFEFQTPAEWDVHGVRGCSFWVIEFRQIEDERFIMAISPVLSTFFEFLYRRGYKDDGMTLARVVREIEPKKIRESREARGERVG